MKFKDFPIKLEAFIFANSKFRKFSDRALKLLRIRRFRDNSGAMAPCPPDHDALEQCASSKAIFAISFVVLGSHILKNELLSVLGPNIFSADLVLTIGFNPVNRARDET